MTDKERLISKLYAMAHGLMHSGDMAAQHGQDGGYVSNEFKDEVARLLIEAAQHIEAKKAESSSKN